MNLPDWLTNPAVIAALSALAVVLASKRPFVSAALKAVIAYLTKDNPQPAVSDLSVQQETRCSVLRGVRHAISEQENAEQRAADLKLCDEFKAMLKRLDEPAVAA